MSREASATEAFRLYGAELSLYSGKVRSYLQFKRIPFVEVLATKRVIDEVIVPKVGFRVIPVVETPERLFLQDSTEIIDAIEARFPEPGIYPSSPKQKLVALLLELFGDEWLVLAAMHFRWRYDAAWIEVEFGRAADPDADERTQRELGSRMSELPRSKLPWLGVTEQMAPGIEASYLEFLADLDLHFRHHEFVLGGRPSIADFGLMGPLYAHLYRDPTPGALMRRRAPAVAAWVGRMRTHAERPPGQFLEDDEIPVTLLPILRRQMDEQMPVLAATAPAVAYWARRNPGTMLPRVIGWHEYRIGGSLGRRGIQPYAQWMLQRAKDHYHRADAEERTAMDQILDVVGGERFRGVSILVALKREAFRLVLA